jgi:phenylpropionate dioxygenase-like ring-hydroxylating dioxygenase large terminal subunit
LRTPPRSRDDELAFLDAARPFWHPVARSEDLSPGEVLGVQLLEEELVLWRTPDGRVALADDLCAHRGTMMSAGGTVTPDGCLRCPYHAWEFDAEGQCRRIPQLANQAPAEKVRVPAYRVVERAGLVWACLADEGTEVRGIPEVPQADAAGWWLHAGAPPTWECQAPRMVENFLDVAHFGTLHADNFGNPDVETVEPYRPVTDLAAFQIDFEFPYLTRDRWSPPVDGQPATRLVHYEYRVELPFAAWIKGAGVNDTPYYTFIAVQPVSAELTKIYWVVTFPDSMQYSDDELAANFLPFFEEDQRVVEKQRPEWLPLDLTDELQMRFDRIAVAYRQALAELKFPVLRFKRSTAAPADSNRSLPR